MRRHLLKILKQFPGKNILVIGDLIADEFLYGRIARVSREAPVLVLEYHDLVRLPGGAANAAHNLVDLGCHAIVAGFIGRDEAGREITQILKRKGADVRFIRPTGISGTPVKTRILAGAPHSTSQQVVRVDRVFRPAALHKISPRTLRSMVRNVDAIILSDYGYGTITANLVEYLAHECRQKSIPLVVDSRFRMEEFFDVTAITPNITELEAAVGMPIGNDAARLREIGLQVLNRQRLKALLVTQGKFGMTLFQTDKEPLHIPIYGTDEIADVTGAGDTVIAVFTLALACGAPAEHAARLANYGGGIVVMKRGTATVTRDELRAAIYKDHPSRVDV